jgi:hypothetical protein
MADSNELRITIDDTTVDTARGAIPQELESSDSARKAGTSAREIVKELKNGLSDTPVSGRENPVGTPEANEVQEQKPLGPIESLRAQMAELGDSLRRLKTSTDELRQMREAAANRTETASGRVPTGNPINPSDIATGPRRASGEPSGERESEGKTEKILGVFSSKLERYVEQATEFSEIIGSWRGAEDQSGKTDGAFKNKFQRPKTGDDQETSPKQSTGAIREFFGSVWEKLKSFGTKAAGAASNSKSSAGRALNSFARIGRFALRNESKGQLRRAAGRVVSSSMSKARGAYSASMATSRAAGSAGLAATARAAGAATSAFMATATGLSVLAGVGAIVTTGFVLLAAGIRALIPMINEMRERLRDYMPKTAVAEARGDFNTQVSRLRTGLREDSSMATFRESQLRIGLAFEKISDSITGMGLSLIAPISGYVAYIAEIAASIMTIIREFFDMVVGLPKQTVTLLFDSAVEPILVKLIEIYNKIPLVDDVDTKKAIEDIRAKVVGEPARPMFGGAELDPWVESLLFGVPIPK